MDFLARAGGMAVAATQAVGRRTGDGKHEPRSIGTQEGVSANFGRFERNNGMWEF